MKLTRFILIALIGFSLGQQPGANLVWGALVIVFVVIYGMVCEIDGSNNTE